MTAEEEVTVHPDYIGYFEDGVQYVNIEGEKYKVVSGNRWWEDPKVAKVLEDIRQAGVMT